jgi:hypothetical protein
MEADVLFTLTVVVAIIFIVIAVFQVMLSLGFPLGEMALGGYYKVLPRRLRFLSAVNAMMLLVMAIVFLQHSEVITKFDFLPTDLLVWVITIFLAINTLANFLSRSKKERLIMTPISGIVCVLCFIITIS